MHEPNHQPSVEVEVDEEARTVAVRGVVDLAGIPLFERALDRVGTPCRVDLREVPFMDSSGLALLLDRTERARARGDRLEVRASLSVLSVIELARVAGELDLVDA